MGPYKVAHLSSGYQLQTLRLNTIWYYKAPETESLTASYQTTHQVVAKLSQPPKASQLSHHVSIIVLGNYQLTALIGIGRLSQLVWGY